MGQLKKARRVKSPLIKKMLSRIALETDIKVDVQFYLIDVLCKEREWKPTEPGKYITISSMKKLEKIHSDANRYADELASELMTSIKKWRKSKRPFEYRKKKLSTSKSKS